MDMYALLRAGGLGAVLYDPAGSSLFVICAHVEPLCRTARRRILLIPRIKCAVTDADHEAVDIHTAGKAQFSNSHDRAAL